MGQVVLWLLLIGICSAQNYDVNIINSFQRQQPVSYSRSNLNEPYRSFELPQDFQQKRLNLQRPRRPYSIQPQTLRPVVIQTPRRPAESADYPIVITPRRAVLNDAEPAQLQYSYRPTELEYKIPEGFTRAPIPRPRRPVITIDPQRQLPYGKPYIRVPFDVNNRQRPVVIRRPPIPQREFGPFGPSGPLSDYPEEFTDNRVIVNEYPEYIPAPYAPKYTNYIPSLRFRHDMNPGTGEYDVEFDTANGIYQKESGFVKRIGVYNPITRQYEEKPANVKTGIVSWTSPEGIPFSFSYIADENGYRPTPLVQALSPRSLSANPSNSYNPPIVPYK